MTQEESSSPHLTLDEVTERVEAWRKDPKSPRLMPEELWTAAVSLTKEYTIHRVSKTLRVNYTALKKRVHPGDKGLPAKKVQPHAFIELGIGQSPAISECVIEMEDSSGARMKMHFRGKTDLDLLELGKAFWRKGR